MKDDQLFDVILDSVKDGCSGKATRAVRFAVGHGQKECFQIVDYPPSIVKRRVSRERAEELRAEIEVFEGERIAEVSIRPAGEFKVTPPPGSPARNHAPAPPRLDSRGRIILTRKFDAEDEEPDERPLDE